MTDDSFRMVDRTNLRTREPAHLIPGHGIFPTPSTNLPDTLRPEQLGQFPDVRTVTQGGIHPWRTR